MRIFNTATEQVKQGGTRRGANMAILRVDHPDIEEFIDCKKKHRELNNFNISVGVTEAFMRAVQKREPYELIDPRDGRKTGQLDASEVYHRLFERHGTTVIPALSFWIESTGTILPRPSGK